MPFYIHKKTECPLCGKAVQREEAIIGFPAFLKNNHSLSFLSDAVVHQHCFDSWEHRGVFLELLDAFREILRSRPTQLHWREGELWMKAQGEKFDVLAASLDPKKA